MDIIIFMIVSVFGLILTFLGFRYVEFGFFALILCIFNFGSLVTTGLSEVIGYESGSAVTRTFDLSIIPLIPLLFAIVNFLILWKYFKG